MTSGKQYRGGTLRLYSMRNDVIDTIHWNDREKKIKHMSRRYHDFDIPIFDMGTRSSMRVIQRRLDPALMTTHDLLHAWTGHRMEVVCFNTPRVDLSAYLFLFLTSAGSWECEWVYSTIPKVNDVSSRSFKLIIDWPFDRHSSQGGATYCSLSRNPVANFALLSGMDFLVSLPSS
ncbi:hypothetical protein BV22DRAFT_320353 [Leucogyrophana mollusca]|uniref:Uncharacterized protein n=1 Tax=Leucogyrophana mollusca TaxID=85980 RepID=A0ACB8BMV3_9AGAM|nr:hypothetical protein BV22DRAFT_320353 [Leucogyrophana mollusca]